MGNHSGYEGPAIHVYYSSVLNDPSFFNQLLYGIEEEGIPFILREKEQESAVELGFQAALDSRLDVGIGIGKDKEMVLHYAKLEKDHPLFRTTSENAYCQNVLGANAARLVKGVPFKSFEIPGKDRLSSKEVVPADTDHARDEPLTKEDISEIVTVVLEVLKRLEV